MQPLQASSFHHVGLSHLRELMVCLGAPPGGPVLSARRTLSFNPTAMRQVNRWGMKLREQIMCNSKTREVSFLICQISALFQPRTFGILKVAIHC